MLVARKHFFSKTNYFLYALPDRTAALIPLDGKTPPEKIPLDQIEVSPADPNELFLRRHPKPDSVTCIGSNTREDVVSSLLFRNDSQSFEAWKLSHDGSTYPCCVLVTSTHLSFHRKTDSGFMPPSLSATDPHTHDLRWISRVFLVEVAFRSSTWLPLTAVFPLRLPQPRGQASAPPPMEISGPGGDEPSPDRIATMKQIVIHFSNDLGRVLHFYTAAAQELGAAIITKLKKSYGIRSAPPKECAMPLIFL